MKVDCNSCKHTNICKYIKIVEKLNLDLEDYTVVGDLDTAKDIIKIMCIYYEYTAEIYSAAAVSTITTNTTAIPTVTSFRSDTDTIPIFNKINNNQIKK